MAGKKQVAPVDIKEVVSELLSSKENINELAKLTVDPVKDYFDERLITIVERFDLFMNNLDILSTKRVSDAIGHMGGLVNAEISNLADVMREISSTLKKIQHGLALIPANHSVARRGNGDPADPARNVPKSPGMKGDPIPLDPEGVMKQGGFRRRKDHWTVGVPLAFSIPIGMKAHIIQKNGKEREVCIGAELEQDSDCRFYLFTDVE